MTTFATGLGQVYGLARGEGGEFYVTRYGFHDIWYVSPQGVVTPDWSDSTNGCVDGPHQTATWGDPFGTVLHDGTVYVADRGCHSVRRFDFAVPTVQSTWGRLKSIYR